MHDVPQRYVAAVDEVDRHMHRIAPGQWENPTPCTEWDVRALVDHIVYETLWVPDLLAGRTLEEIGSRFEGDRLGADPVAAWGGARAAAVGAVRSSALGVPVHTSSGPLTADEYLTEMLFDASIHGWDLARGIGVEHAIPDDVARDLRAWLAPQAEEWVAAGLIAEPVGVDDDADAMTALIASSGRTP
jgi:uncharacterized protein (TIGR03086 family)